MQPKSDENQLGHRRAIFLSSNDSIDNNSSIYTKCLSTPTITEEYQYIALNIATIANSNIYTVQNDVNEKVHFDFEYYYVNDSDIANWTKPETVLTGPRTNTVTITIKQDYYSGEDLLIFLTNEILYKLTYENVVGEMPIPAINTTQDKTWNYMITPYNKEKIIDWYDKTVSRLRLKFNLYTHFGNYIITKIKMRMPNLFGRLLGSNKIDDEIILYKTENPYTSFSSYLYFCEHQFPLTPSLLWCNIIQVRCDWVNNNENSSVLANIPIADILNNNITWINPQLEWSTKKMQFHDYQKIRIQLSNENGYAIDLTNVPFQLEIIIY